MYQKSAGSDPESSSKSVRINFLMTDRLLSPTPPRLTARSNPSDGSRVSLLPAVSQQGPPVFSGRGIDTVETAPFQIRLQFNATGKYFFNDPADPELTVGIITVQPAGQSFPPFSQVCDFFC